MISNLGSFSLSSGATQGAQPAVNTTGLYMATTNDNTKNQIA